MNNFIGRSSCDGLYATMMVQEERWCTKVVVQYWWHQFGVGVGIVFHGGSMVQEMVELCKKPVVYGAP